MMPKKSERYKFSQNPSTSDFPEDLVSYLFHMYLEQIIQVFSFLIELKLIWQNPRKMQDISNEHHSGKKY